MRFRRAAAVAVGLTSLGATTPASADASSRKHDSVERSVVRQLNAIRAQSGARRVRSSRGLARAADAKSGAVAATGDFTHGDMSARVRRYVHADSVGETLAWLPAEQGSDAAAVVRAWMASASHRATLLSGRYRRIGVGRRSGTVAGRRAVVFTVDLASAR
jgi:uncharacterized protein YkwD